MKKSVKKVLSLMLCLVMLMSVFCVNALAKGNNQKPNDDHHGNDVKGTHIDIRVYGTLTIDGKDVPAIVSIDNNKIKFNGSDVTVAPKSGTGIENEFRANIGKLTPETDEIVISGKLTYTIDGNSVEVPFTKTYKGIDVMNGFMNACPGKGDSKGYDIDIDVEELSEPSDGTFSFFVKKTVEQGGDVVPGEETFRFVLDGIVSIENDSVVITPVDSVALADCGIEFTTDTITTNSAGTQTFTLGGTVDLDKVDANHHWQESAATQSWVITLRLTEKNEGKAGWTYSAAVRALTIRVRNGVVSTSVDMLGEDASDNNFTNTYTAYSFTVKKTDADGNPLAGAVFSLTSMDGTAVQSFEATSGADGIATFNVPEGYYTLEEKTAPEGYVKSNETYTLAVYNHGVYFYDENEPDGSNDKYLRCEQVTFVNEKIVTPPADSNPVRDTVTIEIGNNEKTEEANPNTGAPVMFVPVMVAALAGAVVVKRKK
ncbi:MAG: prealbumin-like fold domain-containing protein [Oscillospiraceae bacterium]